MNEYMMSLHFRNSYTYNRKQTKRTEMMKGHDHIWRKCMPWTIRSLRSNTSLTSTLC